MNYCLSQIRNHDKEFTEIMPEEVRDRLLSSAMALYEYDLE